jgi:hypothetical protein
MALHFAVNTTVGFEWSPIGPQFYMTCFNFKVTGNGSATPKGAKFPGAYDAADPALFFDLKSNNSYPLAGPRVHKSEYQVELPPRERVVVSPTGQGEEADEKYYKLQYEALRQQGEMTSYFDSIGG